MSSSRASARKQPRAPEKVNLNQAKPALITKEEYLMNREVEDLVSPYPRKRSSHMLYLDSKTSHQSKSSERKSLIDDVKPYLIVSQRHQITSPVPISIASG